MAMTSRQARLLTWVFGILVILGGLNLVIQAWFDRVGPWRFLLGFGILLVLGGSRTLV